MGGVSSIVVEITKDAHGEFKGLATHIYKTYIRQYFLICSLMMSTSLQLSR